MRRTPILVPVFLVLTAWLTAQEYPQAGPRQTGPGAGQSTVRDYLHGFNGKELALMNNHESIPAVGQSQAEPHSRAHAIAKITVLSSEAKPYDQSGGPALMEIHLNETFRGDIDGESSVRALQVLRDNKSASLVSVQRFRGTLRGRQGTFVLQGSEIVKNGKIEATWFVVPGSGTGDLSGLRGEGGFEGDFGKGSTGTLDYWFE